MNEAAIDNGLQTVAVSFENATATAQSQTYHDDAEKGLQSAVSFAVHVGNVLKTQRLLKKKRDCLKLKEELKIE